jgi:hypothetical protein
MAFVFKGRLGRGSRSARRTRWNVLGPQPETDDAGEDPPKPRRPIQEPYRPRDALQAWVQRSRQETVLHHELHANRKPRWERAPSLDLLQLAQRRRSPCSQRGGYHPHCSHGVLNCQVDADSSDGGRSMGGIPDAEQAGSSPPAKAVHSGPDNPDLTPRRYAFAECAPTARLDAILK